MWLKVNSRVPSGSLLGMRVFNLIINHLEMGLTTRWKCLQLTQWVLDESRPKQAKELLSCLRAQWKEKQWQMESSTAKPNRCTLEGTIWNSLPRLKNSVWPLMGRENPLDRHRSMKTLLWDQPQSKIKDIVEKETKRKEYWYRDYKG